MNAPNTSQADRNALDDHDIVVLDEWVGHGPHAQHAEEPMPS